MRGLVAVQVVALLLCAVNSFAQIEEDEAPAAPPERHVVLDPADMPLRQPGLWSTLSMFEAFDNHVLGDSTTTQPSTTVAESPAGWYSDANAALAYTRGRDRDAFAADGRSTFSYYPSLDRVMTTVSESVSGSRHIVGRTTIEATEHFSYAPYYNLSLSVFPAADSTLTGATLTQGAVPLEDLAAIASPTYRYGGGVVLTQALSDRSSLSFTYSLERTDVTAGNFDLADERIGGAFTHHATRNLILHVGYTLRDGNYTGTGNAVRGNDIDIGADYKKALSFSRHTTLSFTTGSAILDRNDAATGTASAVSGHYFHLLGSATLDHEIGRTWSAQLSYHRDWQLIEGFADPFFTDAVTLAVGGSLNRRTTFGAAASFVTGVIGYGSGSSQQSYRGTSFLRMTVTRSLSAYAEYLYYHYDFSQAVVVPAGLPRVLDRTGARAGLSLSLPLIR